MTRDVTATVTSLTAHSSMSFIGSSENFNFFKNYKKEQKIIDYLKFKRHVMLMQYYAYLIHSLEAVFF